ncbi:hypothetical protein G6F56_009000 [Rhizopus delemar]|nr:hypothetical protein G6F56_009000 [Rhizopus delemar]
MSNQPTRQIRPLLQVEGASTVSTIISEASSSVVIDVDCTSEEWTPDEATTKLNENPGSKISWSNDITGRDKCSSHNRLFRFFLSKNKKYLLIYLGKLPNNKITKTSLCNEAVLFSKREGVNYRTATGIKNYLSSVESNYQRAKKVYFAQSGFGIDEYIQRLGKKYSRKDAEKIFKETVENSCPGFWDLQEAKDDNFKMPLHQNSTDDTDDIGESLDNLGNLRQKESEKVDGASETEYEDLPFYEAESGASETDEEDTEERPPPRPQKKKKTKAEAVSDLNELIVAEVGKTGLCCIYDQYNRISNRMILKDCILRISKSL